MQSERGDDQDAQSRSTWKAPGAITLFIWLHPPLHREARSRIFRGPGEAPWTYAWGDCCGIPVPSGFTAAHEEVARQPRAIEGSGIRPVPFD